MAYNSNDIVQEIAALMRQFSCKYSEGVYYSTHKKFNIILERLYEYGTVGQIVSVYNGRVKGRRTYRYQVRVNYRIVKNYKRSTSAKCYLFREYMKLKKQNEKS